MNVPLEMDSRGVINSRNMGVLTSLVSMVGIRNLNNFRRTLGKFSHLGSYRVWLARLSTVGSPHCILDLTRNGSTLGSIQSAGSRIVPFS